MTDVPLNPYCVTSATSSWLPAWLAGESTNIINKTAMVLFENFEVKDKWSHNGADAKQQANLRWKCVYYVPDQKLMICEAIRQPTGPDVTCFTTQSPRRQINVPFEGKDVLWKTTGAPPTKHYK